MCHSSKLPFVCLKAEQTKEMGFYIILLSEVDNLGSLSRI